MADKETFGQRIRRLRKKQGLNQTQLGDLCLVSVITVNRWEQDIRQPRMEELKRLAIALHVSEDELLNGVPEQNAWVLQIKIAQEFKEEVIDMTQNIPCISSITVTPKGGVFSLGGDYSLWTDDKKFKDLINNIKKTRDLIIQNGRALGGIKD